MTKIWASLMVFACLGLGACSDDEGDDDGGSGSGSVKFNCQAEDDAGEVIGCTQHTVPRAAEEESRDACADEGGTIVGTCPTTNFIGKCSLVMGTLVQHYYSTTGDAADAEEMCTAFGGTWTPA